MASAGGILAFLLIVTMGEVYLYAQRSGRETEMRMQAVDQSAALRARIERELNALLYLSSGLGGYLVVRNDAARAEEVNDILAVLYRNSRHVRNFGVAVGFRLSYVYPLSGNEKAIGLHYPDEPTQWPLIRRIVESRQPALAGPVNLVQGGVGLIYRVPLFLGDRYWGLVSTVIDADALFAAAAGEFDHQRFAFALRGKDASGAGGEVFRGEAGLFADPGAVTQGIDVPGGQWIVAVKPISTDEGAFPALPVRGLVAALGLILGWMLYTLIHRRFEFGRLALHDNLTGLPNRRLLEDRARMAFARQARSPEPACTLLFLDLDGFKEINDRLGHKAGDAVLRITAERAGMAVRVQDTVARWGGDEFIVLIENAAPEVVQALVERLREALENPIDYEGQSIVVGVSIGIAAFPEHGGTFEELLKAADRVMYSDKTGRKAEA